MKKVYTEGLYHYEISGDREADAAAELENRLEALNRSYLSYPRPRECFLDDLADIRQDVARKYGVDIRAEV